MDKPRFILSAKAFYDATDDVQAREMAVQIKKAFVAAVPLTNSNIQIDIKLQRLRHGQAPEGVQM